MTETSTFYNLGIAPHIITILDKIGFKTPTPIQAQSIPIAIEGKDLIGIAQTGTGKTLAFGIPMIQAILQGKRGLVVLPTRELALQVHETLGKFGIALNLRSALVIGGESMGRQVNALRRDPHIIIGTPGRIMDHVQHKTLSLPLINVIVLDEADRMLDIGFAPQLTEILRSIARERQTMLFSATMPKEIIAIANAYMKLPVRVEIAPQGTVAENVTQEVFFIDRGSKPQLLEKILNEYKGSILLFSRTKHGARRIATNIRALGHTSTELHANKSLGQRKEALQGFKDGVYRILVATDIAARGIDVKGIELVLNYDLPSTAEDYVHRIGRTGRAGGGGHAISFAAPDERTDVRDIERLIRATLPVSQATGLPPARFIPMQDTRKAPQRGRAMFGRFSNRSSKGSGRPKWGR